MTVVTILGAGAMGAALTTPAVGGGNEVRLWGTWLDDELIAVLREGRPHPRIDVAVDAKVALFDSGELERALDGADVVAFAISSDGLLDVVDRATPFLRPGQPLAITTKGFGRDGAGKVRLLPPLLEAALPPQLGASCPLVAIGGPCKANEVGADRPTATVFASTDLSAAERCRDTLGTERYRIEVTDDVPGVEVTAATKNVYAIGLGIADGLAEATDGPWHNLKAAVFARAVREMRELATAMGGRQATVYGLAGVGDLEVTGLSGRNKVYGSRIGRGEPAKEALEAMRAAGQTVEGVPAAGLALELTEQLSEEGETGAGAFSLLGAIAAIVDGADDPVGRLAEAALPPASPRGPTRGRTD